MVDQEVTQVRCVFLSRNLLSLLIFYLFSHARELFELA